MSPRVKLDDDEEKDEEKIGSYFSKPNETNEFIPTGCKLLDLILGGGWAEQRVINIIGDKSTCKTLLCIEASANFAKKYPKGKIRYCECESAFDPLYAEALGMPLDHVEFVADEKPVETVEDFHNDLEAFMESSDQPKLYIVDSLDALSSKAEMERAIDAASYQVEKARQLSQSFRRNIQKIGTSNTTLIVVSQIRSKIGMSFGRDTTRSGGRALDFYSSQIVFLKHVGIIIREIKKIKRPIGIKIRAKVDKCKVGGFPYREATFPMIFGYGIDDATACREWLKDEAKQPVKGKMETVELRELVSKLWFEIEAKFLPNRKKKYE